MVLAHNLTVNLSAAGTATITAAQVDGGSAASCGAATLSIAPSTFSCADVGPNVVTLTVTDGNGTSSAATTVVTVLDQTAPLARAQDLSVTLNSFGQASVTAAQINNGSTDNCGIVRLSVNPGTFDCNSLGANSVMLTVTDVNGNVSTAMATVTVADTEAPSLMAPADLQVDADPGQCEASSVSLGRASVEDNCFNLTVVNDAPTSYPIGTTTVTWTAIDGGGNMTTAIQQVTVTDAELPTIVAPAAVTGIGCSTTPISLGQPTVGDNCAGVVVSNDAPAVFGPGTTTVTWMATDASGNVATASQAVTVTDTERPRIVAPAAVTRNACATTPINLGQPMVSDNCAGVRVTNNAPAAFPAGSTTVTWTATDAAGNMATATQLVTLGDTERPLLTVPAAIVRNAAATQCGAVVTFSPTATDNCSGVTVSCSPASGSSFAVGSTTVNVTATDAAGNVRTGSFTVTVRDVTAPTVVTRNLTVTLVNGAASITPMQVNNGSFDACGIASFNLSRKTFSCANLGNNTVTLTVTDVNGNVASAPAVVTVVGSSTAPAIVVTPANNVYTGGISTNLYLGYGPQSVTLTASGGSSYSWSPATGLSSASIANPVFTVRNAGTYTYTVTVGNASGCATTRSVTLHVEDVRCGNRNDKVIVCHNGNEICISPNAVPAHLGGHPGDQLGECPSSCHRDAALTAAGRNGLLAYPNPAADQTTVSFRARVAGQAQVVVYNELGQRVATLYDGAVNEEEQYSLTLNSQPLAAGLYLCQLVLNGKPEVLRLVITH
jgi:hypothetical protein